MHPCTEPMDTLFGRIQAANKLKIKLYTESKDQNSFKTVHLYCCTFKSRTMTPMEPIFSLVGSTSNSSNFLQKSQIVICMICYLVPSGPKKKNNFGWTQCPRIDAKGVHFPLKSVTQATTIPCASANVVGSRGYQRKKELHCSFQHIVNVYAVSA